MNKLFSAYKILRVFFLVIIKSLYRGYTLFPIFFIKSRIIESYLRKQTNNGTLSFIYKKNTILYPNTYGGHLVMSEVFLFDCMKGIKNCKNVLDIGGYIGESAILLSQYNEKVIVFEPNEESYSLLVKNIRNISNIISHNCAVDGKGDYYTTKQGHEYDCGSEIVKGGTKRAYSIGEILERDLFDGIKIDIEGGEYAILEFLMKEEKFAFMQGIIEFHFYDHTAANKKLFFEFVHFIKDRSYGYNIYDNQGKTTTIDSVSNQEILLCNLSFYKL